MTPVTSDFEAEGTSSLPSFAKLTTFLPPYHLYSRRRKGNLHIIEYRKASPRLLWLFLLFHAVADGSL